MTISIEEKTAQLEKLLKARILQGSESLRAFLRFVVQSAIADPDVQLKEYIIATEVFGRRSDYDPRIDSVVRVQAGRLRAKLLEYYATEGKDDTVLLDLPKGQYTPRFTYFQTHSDEYANGGHGIIESSDKTVTDFQQQIFLPLWGEFLRPPEPVLVVFSNSIFHGTYTDMKLFSSLELVAGQQEIPTVTTSLSSSSQTHRQVIDHYTGIGEVMGVYFLGDFFGKMRHPFRIKRSLLLTWDDVKMENIIVLGSPAENLFLLDLPQKQDFIFSWIKDEQGRLVYAIANNNPHEGEQPYYLARQFGESPSQISEDYAVISSLQGLSEKNRLLILGGINTFGTQAATEYVTQPEYIKDLVSHLNIAPPGEAPRLPTYFQILVRVKVNGGVPIQITYVTHHVL